MDLLVELPEVKRKLAKGFDEVLALIEARLKLRDGLPVDARIAAVKMLADPKRRIACVEQAREEAKRLVFAKRKQGIAPSARWQRRGPPSRWGT